MKTKSFGKLIALALCVAMAFSMPVTAFAAEPVEVDTGSASKETTVSGADKIFDLSNVNTYSTLLASKYEMYPIGKLTAGQIVEIKASWTPATENLHIGLFLNGSSGSKLYKATNGSVDVLTVVPVNGTYYLMIANPSTTEDLYNVHWSVSVYAPA